MWRRHSPPPPAHPLAVVLLTDIDPPYRTFPFSPTLGKGHFSHIQRSVPLLSLMTMSRWHQFFKIEVWSSVGLECRQCCSKSRCFLYPWCGQVKERRNICGLYLSCSGLLFVVEVTKDKKKTETYKNYNLLFVRVMFLITYFLEHLTFNLFSSVFVKESLWSLVT